MTTLLKNGYVVDSKNAIEGFYDVLINNGKIAAVGKDVNINSIDINNVSDLEILDCSGLIIIPGICDMHVHFRDPGQTYKEDIFSGGEAAAAGGVTAALCMPNTDPVADTPEVIKYITEKSEKPGNSGKLKVKIYLACALTKGLKGNELCDFDALKKAGAVAASDDGKPVRSAKLMREAMVKAHAAGLKVISHCEDPEIIADGIMNDGEISRLLNVKGMNRVSENIVTSREIWLAADLKVPIHIAHVSTFEAVDFIKYAASRGIPVTCETAPHYFTLTEKEVISRDADYRMNPPLRTERDRRKIESAVCAGEIDCIVTDHAPHTFEEKSDFLKAPNGVVGLETLLAVSLTRLYHTGLITLNELVKLICVNPRKILGIDGGGLGVGENADIAVFDPNRKWIVEPSKLRSKSKNTCFKGMRLKGKVKYTFLNGEKVYSE